MQYFVPEALAAPGDNGLTMAEHQSLRTATGRDHSSRSGGVSWDAGGALEDAELVPQREVPQLESGSRFECAGGGGGPD
jgi:hypothetical protein